MSLNVETTVEEGVPPAVAINEGSKISPATKRWLIALSIVLNTLGGVGGPVLLRLYFLHGGTLVWTSSWLQCAGFPVLLIPLIVFYVRERTPLSEFLAPPKLYMWSVVIGIVSGPVSLMLSYSSSFLPVSTLQLLLSTQLAFTAFFSLLIVRKKLKPFMINAVVLLTAAPVIMAMRMSSDRPPDVTNGEYTAGFILALSAAALVALSLPCSEFAYKKISKPMTASMMLQFLFGVNFTSTVMYTIGMVVNKDFQAIPREAKQFDLGPTKYYAVLVCSGLVWQFSVLGLFSLIYLTSAIFMGVFGAAMLPLTVITALIVFDEKFTGDKGMAVFLCLWGFTSYVYGSYLEMKKQKQKSIKMSKINVSFSLNSNQK